MKKIIKLVIMLLIFGGLIAGYVIIMSKNTEQPITDPVVDEDTAIEVFDLGNEVISKIEYSYKNENLSLSYSDGNWKMTDDEAFPVSSTYPDYMKNVLTKVSAKRIVSENLENENDYGMDKPSMVVKCTTANNAEYTFTIGAYNSVVKGYYFKVSSVDKIFLIDTSILSYFSYGKLDMIQKDKLPTVNSEDITTVDCTVDGKKYYLTTDGKDADFYSNIYAYFTYDANGNKIAVDAVAGAEIVSAVSSATLGNVHGYKLYKETLEEYGLSDTKYAVIKVNYNKKVTTDNSQTSASVTTKESYSFYVGKYTTEDSKTIYYAMLENSDIVYELKNGEALFKAITADLSSNLVCPFTTSDIENVKVEINGKSYLYSLSEIKNNEKAKGVFNSITGITKVGTTDSQKGDVVLKITFDLGSDEMVLTAFKYDESNVIVSFDKWDNLLVSSEKIDNIIKKIEA